jgi:hypothetical protein
VKQAVLALMTSAILISSCAPSAQFRAAPGCGARGRLACGAPLSSGNAGAPFSRSLTGPGAPLTTAEQTKFLASVTDVRERAFLSKYIGGSAASRAALRARGSSSYVLVVVDKDGVYHSNVGAIRQYYSGRRLRPVAVEPASPLAISPISPSPISSISPVSTDANYGYDVGTGPYRRIFTANSQAAYTCSDPNFCQPYETDPVFIEAGVNTYCKQGAYTAATIGYVSYGQDAGQLYLGGRPSSAGSSEVDAGLQYNRFTGTNPPDPNGLNDTYTPYIHV